MIKHVGIQFLNVFESNDDAQNTVEMYRLFLFVKLFLLENLHQLKNDK